MKSNSFLKNRKALTALLLCTGFVATQPFSVMAEEIVTAVQTVQQQKQSVSGTIKDPVGEPVIGASILEKGTTNGTITDFDGNFTLNVAPGATLVISYIGYKNQEMKVIPGKSLNIILQEDTETLEEVVVVGYGVQKKSDVTGSVTSVGKERLGKLPVTNVLQAVQGAAQVLLLHKHLPFRAMHRMLWCVARIPSMLIPGHILLWTVCLSASREVH